jgi:hypothetical protein
MSREKARQPKCHSSALSQQDQNSSEIADIREIHIKCSTRSMLHKIKEQGQNPQTGRPCNG